jgi:hypothetical protein
MIRAEHASICPQHLTQKVLIEPRCWPRLALHVPMLWQDDLPGILATVHVVQTMLNGAA